MKMKPRFASILALLMASAPLLSASEIERLRSLVAEQELQIQQLELKVSQLTNSATPASIPAVPEITSSTPVSTPAAPQITSVSASEEVLVPTAETCPEPVSTENPATYTVQTGDNMVKIARNHGTTSAILNEINGLKKDDIIRPGQKLKLPASASIASTQDAPVPVATPVVLETPAPSTVKHTVTSGETFFSIAKKHNVSTDALVKENPSINPKALRIGQVVQIPTNADTANLSPVPAPEQTLSLSSQSQRNIPISSQSAATVSESRAADKPIKITKEISYSEFAKTYNTTPARLDQLNGLRLDPSTILAKGSELYIPEQP